MSWAGFCLAMGVLFAVGAWTSKGGDWWRVVNVFLSVFYFMWFVEKLREDLKK